MSVTEDLSVRIAQADFRALPPEVVEVAKTVILDGLGVTLPWPARWSHQRGWLLSMSKRWGEPPEPRGTADQGASMHRPRASRC